MQARAPIVLGDQELTEDFDSNTARSSQVSGDIPAPGGSDLDQSADIDGVEYDPATYGLAPRAFVCAPLLVKVAKLAPSTLSPNNLDTIWDFNHFVRQKTTPQGHLDSMLALSALKPVEYHCCKNSCVCYAGYLANLVDCPYCHTPRLNSSGRPYAVFQHIPLIPQLRALFWNPETYRKLLYRANFIRSQTHIRDVFDGIMYQTLCSTPVVIDGAEKPYCHFEDFRELALAIAIDGMGPFKKQSQSCWPILTIIYNFPPEIQTHLSNMICTGVIPGPHLPKDLNSFLQPLIDKLAELAQGVETVDVVNEEIFALRAHVLSVFGDLPAMAKIMEFVGHNGRFPCRLCKIMSVLGHTTKNGTHLYCPLHRLDGTGLDPHNLPLQTHQECVDKGYSVLRAPNDSARAELATECGIKGVTLLVRLSSIRIPDSFPVEGMHLLLINLIPQLADLWRKKFKGIDSGFETYVINSLLWDSIGTNALSLQILCQLRLAALSLISTINLILLQSLGLAGSTPCAQLTASPVYGLTILHRAIMRSEIQSIRDGFIEWVQEFEEIYYQHDPNRLQVCTTNVHYLLHIADSIERFGPLPGYWAFPMERYCSFIGASVKSQQFPYANIACRVCDVAQLCIIRKVYGLRKEIAFGQTRAETKDNLEKEKQIADIFQDYNDQLFLTPQVKRLTVTPELRSQIANIWQLLTKCGLARSLLWSSSQFLTTMGPNVHKGWGQSNPSLRVSQAPVDGHNASFVRYELAIDRLAHCPRATPEFEVKSFYGQLQRHLPLPPNTIINREDYPKFLILAFILEANVTIEDAYKYQVIWYKGKLGSGEVVNAQTIQCAVGRIPDVIIFDEQRVYVILLSRYSYEYICHSLIGVRRAFIGPRRRRSDPWESPPPGQKSDPGRLRESDPQVKVRSLSKIRPPGGRKDPTLRQSPTLERRSDPGGRQKSDPLMEIRPRQESDPEEDEDPNPTRDRTFTSAPRPSIPTSGRVRIPGHPTPRVGLSVAFGYTV
ncbi:Transposase family tnp2 [Rhizoctonia solani]|uniref:Transposase family tnp2 n=1 Tax=Rhizoctonia solani TaxID=456999 RepID=A0A8H7IAH1_9AGAM|nr:Transposase family tnp2 [Rhizoctonia solani]